MSRPDDRVVPWMNHKEFLGVFKGLYADQISAKQAALDTVAVWRCQAVNRLPVAIDSTATLVACLLDCGSDCKKRCKKSSEHQVRLALAIALIRFVNHIVEKGQNKHFAQPVHVLAEEFGLPEWLVDLRHDSTHGSLPSLDLLQEGVTWSLKWLQTEYWEKQTTPMGESIAVERAEDGNLDKQIQNLLVNYTQAQFEQVVSDQPPEFSSNSVKEILSEVERVFPKTKSIVVSILVQNGYLILTRDQLQALGVSDTEFFSGKRLGLPEKVILLWKPMLKLLHNLGASPLVLQILCEQLSMDSSFENRLRAGWISEIVSSNRRSALSKNLPDTNLFSAPCSIPKLKLAKLCLQNPNSFSTELVENILRGEDLDKDLTQMLDLVKIYTQKAISAGETSSNFVLCTVQHLKAMLPKTEGILCNANKFQETVSDSPWQLCTNMSELWSCPIGLLPNQDLSELCLDLDRGGGSSMAFNSQSDPTDGLHDMDISNNSDTQSTGTSGEDDLPVPVINLL